MALHGLLCAVNVQAGDEWKQRSETALEDIHEPTKMRWRSHSNVKEAGTILVVMKAGVAADRSTDFRFSNTKVRAGQIENEGGVMGILEGKTTSKQFKVGETLYLTKTAIGDDYVRLHVVSTEMHEIQEKGSTKPMNYKAAFPSCSTGRFSQQPMRRSSRPPWIRSSSRGRGQRDTDEDHCPRPES